MRGIIRKLVENRVTWAILNFAYKVTYRFKFEKDLIEIEKQKALENKLEENMKQRFSSLTVKNGLFKGMKYPDFRAHGSSLYPKLLGSYESELNSTIEAFLKKEYTTIVDVGCAEGFYTVGMAMRAPLSKVFAYDINDEAISACRRMADLNGVSEQITFGKFCDSRELANFDFRGRGLVISDCEGYEIDLFTPEAVTNLKNCDIIIELHDLYNERISPEIEDVFSRSHLIKKIYSESTFKKLRDFSEAKTMTEAEINAFMLERNGIMAWAVMTPK